MRQSQKEVLIMKVKKERMGMPDKREHDFAIKYLETGYLPERWEKIDLLDGLVRDFETVLSDYGYYK